MTMGNKFWKCRLVVCVVLAMVLAMGEAADEGSVCYDGGSIAGAVLGTFFCTLVLAICGYYFYEYYWKKRREKSPVLVGDPENVKDEFAFDNPGFKNNEAGLAKSGGWQKANQTAEKPATNHDGRTFLDDTFPEVNRRSKIVPLWSQDFTGLGFEVSGSMRDGIYVSRVLRGGPAHESGKIHTGDRINSVRISFRNMVYEDALNILSYASPYELQLEVQSPQNSSTHDKDTQARLTAILTGNTNAQRSPASTLQVAGDKPKKNLGYDSLDKNWKSGGVEIKHPVMAIKRIRCNSNGDLSTVEKSTKQHYLSKPPASPNSTLDSSNHSKNTSLKKMISEKMSSSTLEKNKHQQHINKDNKHHSTSIERENEKNLKNRLSTDATPKIDVRNSVNESDMIAKPERNKIKSNTELNFGTRISTPPDVVIIKDGGDMYSVKNEKSEIQKREPESNNKKAMKFGIRVLPPNVPDDGTINMKNNKHEIVKPSNENGNIVAEIRSIDEVDKGIKLDTHKIKGEMEQKEIKTAPVVAKRREKPVAPVPNARNISQSNLNTVSSPQIDQQDKTKFDMENVSDFHRENELNSSGIKRDARGIPQEIPQHMLEAAMVARNNRKSTPDQNDPAIRQEENISKSEKDNIKLLAKKSKGKAPSPPEHNSPKSREDYDSDAFNNTKNSAENLSMNFTDNFIKETSGVENETKIFNMSNKSDDMILNSNIMNTSTPKVEKPIKRMRPDIPVQKPSENISNIEDITLDLKFKKKDITDSLNNFFEESKSNDFSTFNSSQNNISSDSQNDIDKPLPSSTMIELNSSDITIHSSPVSDMECKVPDENERKASSLGDLSKFELCDKINSNKKVSQGTLERAQSLDISAEDSKCIGAEKNISAKKRKSNSVYDSDYYNDVDIIPVNTNDVNNQVLIHSKEPRLSLDISNITSMENLNTFQTNRLKKASEWGNLEDAIMIKKELNSSSNSGSSEIVSSSENITEQMKENLKDLNNLQLSQEFLSTKNDDNNKIHTEPIKKSVDNLTAKEVENILNNQNATEHIEFGKNKNEIKSSMESIETGNNQKKPDVLIRSKNITENNLIPNFEIGTYISELPNKKYKTENSMISSGKISPQLEEKLNMIYDTNIPDDIKVSRHTLVSSLERPKSDLMKKLLAQNPTLTSNIDLSTKTTVGKEDNYIQAMNSNPDICIDKNIIENKMNSTFTMLNQPDIVNLRIKPKNNENIEDDNRQSTENDYVSNISIVGATTKNEIQDYQIDPVLASNNIDISLQRNYFSNNDNVVTITTDGSQPSSIITIEGDPVIQNNIIENFKNSIEINTENKSELSEIDSNQTDQSLYNEIISELTKSKHAMNDVNQLTPYILTSSKTYLSEPETNFTKNSSSETEFRMLPNKESVTVNVVEDSYGNRLITQNIEKNTQFVTISAPKQSEIKTQLLENTSKNIQSFDGENVIETETSTFQIITNTSIVTNNSTENKGTVEDNAEHDISSLSPLPSNYDNDIIDPKIKIVKMKEFEEMENINQISNKLNEKHLKNVSNKSDDKVEMSSAFESNNTPNEYVTEIEVSTSITEKIIDQDQSEKPIMHNKDKSQQEQNSLEDNYLMNNFLSNEREFSAQEKHESDSYARRKSSDNIQNGQDANDNKIEKRHSDYDLPRNTHIKFRTTTYEQSNPVPNRLSTEKRLSQIEILKSNFEKGNGENSPPISPYKPSVFSKPSNIPIKLPEKTLSPQKMPTISPSKIPILNSQNQKSSSQENLFDKNTNLQKTSQINKLSLSSGNISVTSIKSSSRNPSGK